MTVVSVNDYIKVDVSRIPEDINSFRPFMNVKFLLGDCAEEFTLKDLEDAVHPAFVMEVIGKNSLKNLKQDIVAKFLGFSTAAEIRAEIERNSNTEEYTPKYAYSLI